MLLKEIEKQVENWMEYKAGDLKKQQEALVNESNKQIQTMKEELQHQSAADREKAETIHQQMRDTLSKAQNAAKEVSDTLQEQKRIRDAEMRSLNEQEAFLKRQKAEADIVLTQTKDELLRSLKKKADAGQVEELQDSLANMKQGKAIPMVLSIAAILLVAAAGIIGFLVMKGKLSDMRSEMKDLQSSLIELTKTPVPTEEPTPSPAPTAVPAEYLTDQEIDASLPALLEWEQSQEDRLPLDNVNIVRSYKNDSLYVNVLEIEDGQDISEQDLYTQFGFSAYSPMEAVAPSEPDTAEATAEGTAETDQVAAEPASSETTEAAASEEATTVETEPETGESSETSETAQEPAPASEHGSDDAVKTSTKVVLGTIRFEKYLYVFYVDQNDIDSVDYREQVKVIEGLYDGLDKETSGASVTTYRQAFKNSLCAALVSDAWENSSHLFPACVEFVPEALRSMTAGENPANTVWLYDLEAKGLALVVSYDPATEDEAFNASCSRYSVSADEAYQCAAFRNIGMKAIVVFFAQESNAAWYENINWYNTLTGTDMFERITNG